ncbi:A24 family peptidase [Paraferrimonas sedimenticola]|uniref:Prepilin type IV endopeptidase peptidase domain-containing protein n=1 Tax=Paraferrimonas sedimenticola TaxID=375674 RepID=A0AA37RT77_9GAMM|nr:A24 family peptidase [Paraferrimonas sedimenticola]GLP94896.1 hypothetical protein GCM10007895_02020 [Paraferrimonas sedimenticola]
MDIVFPLLITLLAIAVINDLRRHTIPNLLTFSFIAIGILVHGIANGFEGLWFSVSATGLAFLILAPVVAIKALGAGDAKLMMAVGSLVGVELLLSSLVWGVIFGGFSSLLFAWYRTGWPGFKATLYRYQLQFATKKLIPAQANEAASIKAPYAPALALGTVIAVWQTAFVHTQLTFSLG